MSRSSYLPITRPPEHSAVAGLLPELPVAGVIFYILVLEVHVEVFDATLSVRDLEMQGGMGTTTSNV